MIHQVKKAMDEAGDALDSATKEAANKTIEELEALLKDDNATKEQIDAKVQELTTQLQTIAQKQAQAQQGGAGASETSAKSDDDDVIDAEVE